MILALLIIITKYQHHCFLLAVNTKRLTGQTPGNSGIVLTALCVCVMTVASSMVVR